MGIEPFAGLRVSVRADFYSTESVPAASAFYSSAQGIMLYDSVRQPRSATSSRLQTSIVTFYCFFRHEILTSLRPPPAENAAPEMTRENL
jgi:hypothetical protein